MRFISKTVTELSADKSSTAETPPTEVLPTMYNPNTRVAGMISSSSSSSVRCHNDLANGTSTSGKIITVYAGKNQHPISIIQLS